MTQQFTGTRVLRRAEQRVCNIGGEGMTEQAHDICGDDGADREVMEDVAVLLPEFTP